MLARTAAVYEGPGCPHCHRPLEMERAISGSQRCPVCARGFEAVWFRAPQREQGVVEVASAGPVEAASCAAHRRNAAVASCERCGIFMCALCRTESDGLVICAPCFERMAEEGGLPSAQTRYRDYTGMSWLFGLLGLLLWLPGLVTGPAAIYYAVQGLRQMNQWGDVGGRGRAVAGLALGVVSTIQGGVVAAALFGS